MTTALQLQPPVRLLAFLGLVLGACGGGGGAPSEGTAVEPTGGLSYDPSDFDYVDPNPVDYQPLGLDTTVLTRRDELLIMNVPETPLATRATLFDDIGVGAGVLGEMSQLAGAGAYRAAAAGNLDADGADELVLLRATGSVLEAIQVEREESGDYVVSGGFEIPSAGFDYREARLWMGDVDGDYRDELAIYGSSDFEGSGHLAADFWVRVYDDGVDGWQLLFEETWDFLYPSQGIRDIRLELADVDGDGEDELGLLLLSGSGLNFGTHLRLFDSASQGFSLLENFVPVGSAGGSLPAPSAGVRLLGADLDQDGREELTAVRFSASGVGGGFGGSLDARATVHSFSFDGADLVPAPERAVTHTTDGVLALTPARAFDAALLDRDGDGVPELALLLPDVSSGSFGEGRIQVLAWDGAGWIDDIAEDVKWLNGDDGASLISTDDDADGQGELYFCRIHEGSSSSKSRQVLRIDWGDASGPVTNSWSASVSESGDPFAPVQVAGDFDADGMTVRYTGRKFTSLSDPMPLIVMAAPPTKAGTSQNYAGSSSSYAVAAATSQSYAVSTSVTASVYTGSEVSDVFDLFGASARQTVSRAFSTSESATTSVATIQGFSGGFDADTIVFQGTLYRAYEYQIVAAPNADLVGSYFTLDVPAQSKVYKWTVDYFNSQVEPELRIGPDVLPHTIGDPSTYLSPTASQVLVDQFVGWRDGGGPVGQGSQSNLSAIELQEVATLESQLTYSATWEAGFTVGGSQFGGSFGVSDSFAYSVSTSDKTTYTGVVGDLASPTDWEDWRFDFGLTVYHRGLESDASNQPVGQQPGVRPFQVLTYWALPTGASY